MCDNRSTSESGLDKGFSGIVLFFFDLLEGLGLRTGLYEILIYPRNQGQQSYQAL